MNKFAKASKELDKLRVANDESIQFLAEFNQLHGKDYLAWEDENLFKKESEESLKPPEIEEIPEVKPKKIVNPN